MRDIDYYKVWSQDYKMGFIFFWDSYECLSLKIIIRKNFSKLSKLIKNHLLPLISLK